MSRLKWFVFVVLFVPLLVGCDATVYYQDMELRDWAYGMDDWADEVANWQANTVHPALRSVCELEKNVYDDLHDVTSTTRRICPRGTSTDPPPPPGDPEDWD